MARVLLPIGLTIIFGIGIAMGVGWFLLSQNQIARVKPVEPNHVVNILLPPNCFVAGIDCQRALEKVELNGQFVGYGLKLSASADLLSPITGDTTTGQLSFAPSAGGYRYPILSIHPNGLNDPTRLEYVFAQPVGFSVHPVISGDILLTLKPSGKLMPPYGEYDLLIQAFDNQAQVVNPMIYLP